MADLRAAAENNIARRDAAYDAVAGAPFVVDFAEKVRVDGRVNVGLGASKIERLLVSGTAPSSWEHCEEQAAASGRSPDDHWAENQKDHAIRRGAFESWADRGRSGHYGALAINRRWVPDYGDFAVRLARAPDDRDVYLPGNTAEDYVEADGTVKQAELERDATVPEQRHRLAAIKHAADTRLGTPSRWPRMLCSSDGFVEALFPQLERADVIEVLLKRDAARLLALSRTDASTARSALLATRAVVAAARGMGMTTAPGEHEADELAR